GWGWAGRGTYQKGRKTLAIGIGLLIRAGDKDASCRSGWPASKGLVNSCGSPGRRGIACRERRDGGFSPRCDHGAHQKPALASRGLEGRAPGSVSGLSCRAPPTNENPAESRALAIAG